MSIAQLTRESTAMPVESWAVIREAIEESGPKAVAARLGVSVALVYKWAEAPETPSEPDNSGVLNPLDRVVHLFSATRDVRLIRHVCHAAGGFFVPNPKPVAREAVSRTLLSDTQKMVKEFSDLLETVTESASDGGICTDEAREVRLKWEDMKSAVESLTVMSERGHYDVAEVA